jgi:hypothetical protein
MSIFMKGMDEDSLENIFSFLSSFFGFPINDKSAYSLQVHVFCIFLSIVISIFIYRSSLLNHIE